MLHWCWGQMQDMQRDPRATGGSVLGGGSRPEDEIFVINYPIYRGYFCKGLYIYISYVRKVGVLYIYNPKTKYPINGRKSMANCFFPHPQNKLERKLVTQHLTPKNSQ